MKKIFLLSACLWVLAGPTRAQAGPPDIVVVRVRDYKTSASIFITRGEGKTEKIEVDVKGSSLDKGMTAVSEGYYKVVEKLYQEGYVLQNSTGISDQSGGGVLTYVFVKNH
jgi:hypothetical protein